MVDMWTIIEQSSAGAIRHNRGQPRAKQYPLVQNACREGAAARSLAKGLILPVTHPGSDHSMAQLHQASKILQ